MLLTEQMFPLSAALVTNEKQETATTAKVSESILTVSWRNFIEVYSD